MWYFSLCPNSRTHRKIDRPAAQLGEIPYFCPMSTRRSSGMPALAVLSRLFPLPHNAVSPKSFPLLRKSPFFYELRRFPQKFAFYSEVRRLPASDLSNPFSTVVLDSRLVRLVLYRPFLKHFLALFSHAFFQEIIFLPYDEALPFPFFWRFCLKLVFLSFIPSFSPALQKTFVYVFRGKCIHYPFTVHAYFPFACTHFLLVHSSLQIYKIRFSFLLYGRSFSPLLRETISYPFSLPCA